MTRRTLYLCLVADVLTMAMNGVVFIFICLSPPHLLLLVPLGFSNFLSGFSLVACVSALSVRKKREDGSTWE